MHACRQNCSITGLCTAFLKTERAGNLDYVTLMAAVTYLGDYAADNGWRVCEIDIEKMAGFVNLLNSQESAEFTGDDIHGVLYIIRLFYDYLLDRGCVADNPLAQLQQQAIEQFLQQLEKRGLKRENLDDYREDADD